MGLIRSVMSRVKSILSKSESDFKVYNREEYTEAIVIDNNVEGLFGKEGLTRLIYTCSHHRAKNMKINILSIKD